MGCAVVLVAFLGILIGLTFLPTVNTFITEYVDFFPAGWDDMEAVVLLLPFAFLILVFFGAIRWISRV